jgi:predicted HTH transcriptional regulator
MPEDADLDFKGEDSYTTSGPDGLDELAKDITALANARGGLIIIGINEDSQGCAESLSEVEVSDKKIGQPACQSRALPSRHLDQQSRDSDWLRQGLRADRRAR